MRFPRIFSVCTIFILNLFRFSSGCTSDFASFSQSTTYIFARTAARSLEQSFSTGNSAFALVRSKLSVRPECWCSAHMAACLSHSTGAWAHRRMIRLQYPACLLTACDPPDCRLQIVGNIPWSHGDSLSISLETSRPARLTTNKLIVTLI